MVLYCFLYGFIWISYGFDMDGIGILYGFVVGIFTISVGLGEDAMWGFIIPFQIYIIVFLILDIHHLVILFL